MLDLITSEITLISSATARSSKGMLVERDAFNSGVFETHVSGKMVSNRVSRSAYAHYRCDTFKCDTKLVIRSGRQSIQFKKNL